MIPAGDRSAGLLLFARIRRISCKSLPAALAGFPPRWYNDMNAYYDQGGL